MEVRTEVGGSFGPLGPFLGAKSFTDSIADRARFFGRDQEARELHNLLIAQRVVLLHAPSGAGKTSLLRARLIPELQASGFVVPPVIRVGYESGNSPGTTGNRYVASLLAALHPTPSEPGVPCDATPGPSPGRPRTDDLSVRIRVALRRLAEDRASKTPPGPIPAESLPAGSVRARMARAVSLKGLQPDEGQAGRVDEPPLQSVLIFDQFEELLTSDPTDIRAKRTFCAELGRALRDAPDVWALFAMRDDYVAALDPYLSLLPKQLQVRYCLNLLGPQAAAEAIHGPIRAAGFDATDDAVERLVDGLRTVRLQRGTGTGADGDPSRTRTSLGPYVEPYLLQVVCEQFWERWREKRPGERTVTAADVKAYARITQSLEGYYADRVAKAARDDLALEARVRDWVESRLITPSGVRGVAMKMAGPETLGLDNDVIGRLADASLVRIDRRRGEDWIELTHDRLIEPIRRSNAAWFRASAARMQSTYDEAMARASGGEPMRERALRDWIEDRLITVDGTPAEVPVASAQDGKPVDAQILDVLEGYSLLRRTHQGGQEVVGLSHDRLVEPIQKWNGEWYAQKLNPFQLKATLWRRQGRPPKLLLVGHELSAARDWAKPRQGILYDADREFFEACEQALQASSVIDRTRFMFYRNLTYFTAAAALLFAGLLVVAVRQGNELSNTLERYLRERDAKVEAEKAREKLAGWIEVNQLRHGAAIVGEVVTASGPNEAQKALLRLDAVPGFATRTERIGQRLRELRKVYYDLAYDEWETGPSPPPLREAAKRLLEACAEAMPVSPDDETKQILDALRQSLYARAVEVTQQLASTADHDGAEGAQREFWRLYFGELWLVEEDHFESLMVKIGRLLERWDGERGRPPAELRRLADELRAEAASSRERAVEPALVRIERGIFQMGSPESVNAPGTGDEKPRHRVEISRPFLLGKYEVTQTEYERVMGDWNNPSRFRGPGYRNHPVEYVTWLEAVRFCNRMSELKELPSYYSINGETVGIIKVESTGYRLPTEAEWEYACRAGTTTDYSFGDDPSRLGEFEWYRDNSGNTTHPVGAKKPNRWGLYDMHGNVREWCWDRYDEDFYLKCKGRGTVVDPQGPDEGPKRLSRGGSYFQVAEQLRSAYRLPATTLSGQRRPVFRNSVLGFRVARTILE